MIRDWTDDALALRFERDVRLAQFDCSTWQKGGSWVRLPDHSRDWAMQELVRQFCRQMQGEVLQDASLTQAQIDREIYRLGQSVTFRKLMKLINVPVGKDALWHEVREDGMRDDLVEPGAAKDFSATNDGFLGSRTVMFKGRETKFEIRPTLLFGRQSKAPFTLCWSRSVQWKEEYASVEDALEALSKIAAQLFRDPAPAKRELVLVKS